MECRLVFYVHPRPGIFRIGAIQNAFFGLGRILEANKSFPHVAEGDGLFLVSKIKEVNGGSFGFLVHGLDDAAKKHIIDFPTSNKTSKLMFKDTKEKQNYRAIQGSSCTQLLVGCSVVVA